MPIDPNIPLSVKPAQIDSPVEMAANYLRFQEYRQKSMEMMRARQEDEQIRSIFQQSQGDIEGALPKIRQINPLKAAAIEKTYTESRKAQQELLTSKIDHDLKIIDYTARQLSDVKDQTSYDYARAGIKATTGQDLPEQYDPALVEGWQQKGMTLKERLTLKHQELVDNAMLQRDAALQADRKADNERADARAKVQEDISRAQLDVSRGQLAVARGNLAVRQNEANKPAGAKSAGGRGVTSGDANRMADFDTSLDDLAALEDVIGQSGATGTAAKIGASLPNVVTDLTGWGTEAKSKQATIDRVKQVIGKTLEGGVLRKEDEYKYTKILPTIGDTQEVVKSKLTGLKAAIAQRRERQLESLEDAGYDTSRYRARTPPAPAQTTSGKRFQIISVK